MPHRAFPVVKKVRGALTVACPNCTALALQVCRAPNGRPLTESHPRRVIAARKRTMAEQTLEALRPKEQSDERA